MISSKKKLLVSFLGTALIGLSACGEPNISQEKAAPYVDQWSGTVEETLREMAVAPAGKEKLQKRLQKAAAADDAKVQRDEPPYDRFVDDAYSGVDYQFKLVEPGGLTERGKAVWDALQAVETHALDVDDYQLAAIEEALADLEDANARFEKLETFEVSDAEESAAEQWLVAQPVSTFELDEENYDDLTKTLLESGDGERMQARLADYETVSGEIAEAEARVEHLLARNLARYARQMKHFRIREIFVHPKNFDRWTNPNIEGRRPDKAEAVWHARSAWRTAAKVARGIGQEKKTDILYGRIRDTLEQTLTGDAQAAVASIAPSQPQYEGLRKEYVRYKKIADEGGWEKVPETRGLRPGREHETVAKLKKRLQVEDYYPADAPIDKKYDEKLEQAVEAYQKTHQMRVTGKPHHMFWSSVNIPAKRRMQQIAVNMERWRKSNIRHGDPMYVFINIPDFTAEVWKNQERQMRMRVVVGNNDLAPKEKREKARREKDEDFKDHPNRTPTLSAYIDRVIYNPYWNVTERIRDEEILPEVRAAVEASYKARIKSMVGGSKPAPQADEEQDQALTGQGPTVNPGTQSAAGSAAESIGSDALMGQIGGDAETIQNTFGAAKAQKPSKPTRSAESYWSKNGNGRIVFDVAALKKLVGGGATGSGPSEGAEAAEGDAPASPIAGKFPYIDPATGLVDINSTKPDAIPGWYEANNYEVMFPGKKWEYVRMKQGDDNALGKVKVIFPNMYDVYLHDTPHKNLFSRDIRAFSHGCMRMHEPLTFAEYLLEQDGKLDEYNVDHILRETKYEPIFLDRQVPVHIDYLTVRVDEEGRANFLADIYDYDRFEDEG